MYLCLHFILACCLAMGPILSHYTDILKLFYLNNYYSLSAVLIMANGQMLANASEV